MVSGKKEKILKNDCSSRAHIEEIKYRDVLVWLNAKSGQEVRITPLQPHHVLVFRHLIGK